MLSKRRRHRCCTKNIAGVSFLLYLTIMGLSRHGRKREALQFLPSHKPLPQAEAETRVTAGNHPCCSTAIAGINCIHRMFWS